MAEGRGKAVNLTVVDDAASSVRNYTTMSSKVTRYQDLALRLPVSVDTGDTDSSL